MHLVNLHETAMNSDDLALITSTDLHMAADYQATLGDFPMMFDVHRVILDATQVTFDDHLMKLDEILTKLHVPAMTLHELLQIPLTLIHMFQEVNPNYTYQVL